MLSLLSCGITAPVMCADSWNSTSLQPSWLDRGSGCCRSTRCWRRRWGSCRRATTRMRRRWRPRSTARAPQSAAAACCCRPPPRCARRLCRPPTPPGVVLGQVCPAQALQCTSQIEVDLLGEVALVISALQTGGIVMRAHRNGMSIQSWHRHARRQSCGLFATDVAAVDLLCQALGLATRS